MQNKATDLALQKTLNDIYQSGFSVLFNAAFIASVTTGNLLTQTGSGISGVVLVTVATLVSVCCDDCMVTRGNAFN